MPTYTVANLEFELFNGQEVIRMGGPCICDARLNNELIIEKCLSQNFVYDEKGNLLFFLQYHKINYYEYFTINFYQILTKETYQFTREFDMAYLGSLISDHELEIFHAFHDKFRDKSSVFNLDDEDFILLD
ncbi:hypothetical protein HDF18_21810 [Mucilaginibacter sp. X5P1]|uniref:hypothetical protein n=1 Tax=Mucilaginibacter sp. X5P1 TaxID=2723088 RepID=UPI0016173D76|nr:hypothetical protein [Mucilaginibacter sp. X5P1]MBB6140252.1 hypothetical protein [Mucilaginibacter sp. X5P1]